MDKLVTKEYLSGELNDLKTLFYKEMSRLNDGLLKEMSEFRDDLRKEMIIQTRWFLAGIGFIVIAITLILKLLK